MPSLSGCYLHVGASKPGRPVWRRRPGRSSSSWWRIIWDGRPPIDRGQHGIIFFEVRDWGNRGILPTSGPTHLAVMAGAIDGPGFHLWDFDFSLHIRVPVRERWEPYGIAGVGFLWNHVNQNGLGPQNNNVIYHLDQFNGSFVTGGGLRYYLGENWGVRPQLKVIVSTRIYTQLSIGLFYNSNSF